MSTTNYNYSFKVYWFWKNNYQFSQKNNKIFDLKFFNQSFFDDLEILKKTGSFDILKQNPVHENHNVMISIILKNIFKL